jgi:hypothetical protein
MRTGKNIISWVPPAASLCGLVVALWFATSRQMRSAEGIAQVRRLGANLSEVASLAMSGILSPQQAKAIETRRDDLEQRITDSSKPALMQAQLVDAAAETGLVVHEIQPIASNVQRVAAPIAANGKAAEPIYPIYKVSIEGEYQQIAAYMEKCRQLRVPARVILLHIAPAVESPNAAGSPVTAAPRDTLRAELNLEIFVPRETSQDARDPIVQGIQNGDVSLRTPDIFMPHPTESELALALGRFTDGPHAEVMEASQP